MEKFIEKCLNSVCASSYKNLEIICVDDCSPDSSMEIVQKFAEKDDRIKIVTNEKNLGLFRARVEGMKVANGDYICFVDADDFVSIDWFRLLHKKISEEKADMVIGNTVNVDENQVKTYYNNYRSLTSSHKTLKGKEVLETFLKQEGACFIWHTVWNKLYSRKLVEECMPYFKKIDFHLIMGEDIAYSSVFYSHAKSLAFANVDAYFYYRHSEASTSTTLPLEKILKNIADLKAVFDYFEGCMKEFNPVMYNENKPAIEKFKAKYHRIWSGNLYNKNAQNDTHSLDVLENTFGTREIILPTAHDFYFYELTTPWSSRLEKFKEQVVYSEVKVVSFDMFDTLVTRPLYNPQDLYLFVAKTATKLIPHINESVFCDMRRLAEQKARMIQKINQPMFEDVTLSEIYDCFAEIAGTTAEVSNKIKEEEVRLEKEFCKTRNTAKEIFDLALESGKQVIITSDMYLEKDTIEEILKKNGYIGYSHLFLSSDRRSLKATGKLFECVLKELDVKPYEILHIGDNWNVDILKAQEKGLMAAFLPKTIETFENGISDISVGNDLAFYKNRAQTLVEQTSLTKNLVTRNMIAISANKLFDNPFTPFQWESNYNGDTYLSGYYTMGPHFYGIASWILETANKEGYKKIVFLARDGRLAKECFDYLCEKTNTKIETEYFYASRKALLPYSISTANDLYGLHEYLDIKTHSPLQVMDMISLILNPLTDDIKKQYEKSGFVLDKNFENQLQFKLFIDKLIKISFNEELCKQKRAEISSEFKKIFTDKTATFDIGYSGRLQGIISDLANKPVDVFFVHSNGYSSNMTAKGKFKIHEFYNFTPTITAIVREFFVSKQEPSCVGYKIKNGKLAFVFEDKTFDYDKCYGLNEFQKGTLEFCKDFVDNFGEFIEDLKTRNTEVSLPFEHYLLHASQFDRYAFSNAEVEDDVYGGYSAKSIFDIWTWHLRDCQSNSTATSNVNTERYVNVADQRLGCNLEEYLAPKSKFKRAMFFLLFDRKMFKEKFKKNLKNKWG